MFLYTSGAAAIVMTVWTCVHLAVTITARRLWLYELHNTV